MHVFLWVYSEAYLLSNSEYPLLKVYTTEFFYAGKEAYNGLDHI